MTQIQTAIEQAKDEARAIVGKAIKYMRIKNAITIRMVTARVKADPAAIYRIEQGGNATWELIERILKAVSMPEEIQQEISEKYSFAYSDKRYKGGYGKKCAKIQEKAAKEEAENNDNSQILSENDDTAKSNDEPFDENRDIVINIGNVTVSVTKSQITINISR